MIQNKKLYTCPFGSSRIPALISHIFAHILAYLGGVLGAIARICIRPVSLRTILLVICTFLLGCHRMASLVIGWLYVGYWLDIEQALTLPQRRYNSYTQEYTQPRSRYQIERICSARSAPHIVSSRSACFARVLVPAVAFS